MGNPEKKKIAKNERGPWFWFTIPKPGLGRTLAEAALEPMASDSCYCNCKPQGLISIDAAIRSSQLVNTCFDSKAK